MKHWYLIIILWSLIAVACDPCDDCGQPLEYNPAVSVIFINQDSADVLTDSVELRKTTIRSNDSIRRILNVTLETLEDSLEVIEELIDEGETQYEAQRSLLQNDTADIQTEIRGINARKTVLDSLNKIDADILKVINSGKVQVKHATLVENGARIDYEDSAIVYNVPLLMREGASETTYEFMIGDEPIGLVFTYQLYETINDSRVYLIRATDITVTSPTGHSFEQDCVDPDNCLSNETTVTVYF